MAFGFNPGIILAGRQADPVGTARSMADLLQSQQAMGIQREQHQHTLAAMLAKQQEGRRLADIYRQNAANPAAVPQALMGAGFGEQAQDWAQKHAATQKAFEDGVRQRAQMIATPFRDVKDQAGYDAAMRALEGAGVPAEALARLPRDYDPQTVSRFASLGMSSAAAEGFDQKEKDRLAAMARLNAQLGAKKESDAAKAKMEIGKEGSRLRKELLGIPAVKKAIEAKVALGKIETAAKAKSPAGDMALVFSFMTVLDPGSTVREGEYANARNAAGVPERVRNAYNQALDGVLLSDQQRADFSARATDLYKSQAEPARKLFREFSGYAERAGLNPAEVLPDIGFGEETPPDVESDGDTLTTPDGTTWVLQPDGTYLPE